MRVCKYTKCTYKGTHVSGRVATANGGNSWRASMEESDHTWLAGHPRLAYLCFLSLQSQANCRKRLCFLAFKPLPLTLP